MSATLSHEFVITGLLRFARNDKNVCDAMDTGLRRYDDFDSSFLSSAFTKATAIQVADEAIQ